MIVLTSTHSGSDSEMVGFCRARENGQDAPAGGLGHVHHQADLAFGGHGALQHQHHVVHLLPLPRVGVGCVVGDEARVVLCSSSATMRRLLAPQRAAGLRDFDDGVGQARRLDFGRAPAEFDLRLDAVLAPASAASG